MEIRNVDQLFWRLFGPGDEFVCGECGRTLPVETLHKIYSKPVEWSSSPDKEITQICMECKKK